MEDGDNNWVFDAEYEGFLYPGWGAPGQEDSRAFNVFSGSFQSYYLPVANIPFNSYMTKLGWTWNGERRDTHAYAPPPFKVEIKVYVYCGFHQPTFAEAGGMTGNNALPGIDAGDTTFTRNVFTYTWDPADGACGFYSLDEGQRATTSTNDGQYSAISMSVRGLAPTDTVDDEFGRPIVDDEDFVKWRGSFALAAVFRTITP